MHIMPTPPEKRSLGKTGFQITPIGLGVMQFSGNKGMMRFVFPNIPQEEKNKIIAAALAGGINWFDTAELYGKGNSERTLAAALKNLEVADDEVLMTTKWWPFLRSARNIPRNIGTRLRNLGGYTIDQYLVHQPVSFSSPEAEMDAMAELVKAGKIRSAGVSNFNPQRMRRAQAALAKHGLPLASNQVQYSLLNRKIETNGVLQTAKELGVTIVAWGPLASGLLTGKFHKDPELLRRARIGRRMFMGQSIHATQPLIDALEQIGSNYNASPAQVALNWLVNFNGEIVVAIPGASKPEQAEEAAGAMGFKLSAEEIDLLDRLSRQFR